MKVLDFFKGIGSYVETKKLIFDIRSLSGQTEAASALLKVYWEENLKEKLKNPESKAFIESISKYLPAHHKDKDFFIFVKSVLDNIKLLLDSLPTLVPKIMGNEVTADDASYKNVELLQVIAYASFVVEYTFRAFDYYLTLECKLDRQKPTVEKIWLESSAKSYTDALVVLKQNYLEIIKKIESIPRVHIDHDGLAETAHVEHLDPLGFRFINLHGENIIYTFRAWLVDNKHARFKRMENEKKAMELKVLYLRKKLAAEDNVALIPVINNYENEIAIYASKIDRYNGKSNLGMDHDKYL